MPLQNTSGNDTTDAYGGGAAAVPNYIENVFSTYLYTGTGASQSIVNGIDLSTKGGLVWIKSRTLATAHYFQDTVRGANNYISSNATNANTNLPALNTVFNSDGFSQNNSYLGFNDSSNTYVSWTFRKQPKFFDVVTYTGTGSATTIAHNLGSVPGCIIVKRTDATSNWQVYHNGLTSAAYSIQLNSLAAQASATTVWNSTAPTSTVFSVGTDTTVNASGGTYVAYLFASNAGGFGTSGTDNVISCGSFTTDGSGNASVTLGYEPQYVMIKQTNSTGTWFIVDIMRGFSNTQFQYIQANTTAAENSSNASPSYLTPNATGFATGQAGLFAASVTFIYIAIRRGPMKVPTDATKVYNATVTALPSPRTVTAGFPVDLVLSNYTNSAGNSITAMDRLRGMSSSNSPYLATPSTAAEAATGVGYSIYPNNMDGIVDSGFWSSAIDIIYWFFKRAPSFFDEICYTGTGSATTFAHNLGVKPELIILRSRNNLDSWYVFAVQNGFGNLNSTGAWGGLGNGSGINTIWQATSTTIALNSTFAPSFATSGWTYVVYLFATCAGVSKVGTYTGTGATQTISCGFTGGARFVLVKRTDTTGDWYVWDTARGMVSGTDPSLLLNSTAAEVNANSIYTATGGFQIVSTAAGINASGGTYIFLAIA